MPFYASNSEGSSRHIPPGIEFPVHAEKDKKEIYAVLFIDPAKLDEVHITLPRSDVTASNGSGKISSGDVVRAHDFTICSKKGGTVNVEYTRPIKS